MKLVGVTVAAVLATSMGALAAAASAATLAGAGSTLVYPLEQQWATGWQGQTGNTVSYSAVGSGTGISDIQSNQVQFGASDAPMTTSQAAGCNSCIQIPWALSATGVGFNLSGVKFPRHKSLQLSGPVLADIYLGSITNWDDAAIKKLNKGVKLPNLKITPVFRTDGSGDTYAFTNYLSKVSSTFAHKVGTGTLVSFPAGSGNKGNLGVTTTLENTNGAIAYVAVAYLIHHAAVAAIENNDHKFEFPNLQQIENAANYLTAVPNGYSIVDPPKKAKIAYPISTFTYVIVPTTSSVGSLLQSFINYALSSTGQGDGTQLDFAPMPSKVLNAAKADVGKIH
jgi:phosphate transport system substrate-binding protein